MTANAPWLAHYDAGVPATLAPYPTGTLLDYLSASARDASRCSGAALQGLDHQPRRARRLERRVRGGPDGAGRPARRSRRAAAPQLPAVFHRRVRGVEDRRHRRAAESDLHGARARSATERARHRNRRHADALLRAGQAGPAAHVSPAGHCHQHQGALSAAAPAAVHTVPREKGRRSHHARVRRPSTGRRSSRATPDNGRSGSR